MSNAPSLTHRFGHPSHPRPSPSPLLKYQQSPRARTQSRNPEHFRNTILPRERLERSLAPPPAPYPEARGQVSPAGPEALSYVNDLAEAPAGASGAAEREVGRQVPAEGRKKLVFRTTKISRKTAKCVGGRGRGPRGVTFRSTKSNIRKSAPDLGPGLGGYSGLGGSRGTPLGRGVVYAPHGASVPGASVPGKGRGGRSSSTPFPASSRAVFSPSPAPQGRHESWGRVGGPQNAIP